MAKKHIFSAQVDFKGFEALNVNLQSLFNWPPDPTAGRVLFRSDLQLGALYDGAQWLLFGLTEDRYAAIAGANSPSAANVFATMEDLSDLPIIPEDFLDLFDTPSAYTGEGGKVVAVKMTEDGLEFVAAGSGGGADSNAVHYNADDAKDATEKQQARTNIGLDSGIDSTVGLGLNSSNINLPRPTNYVILTSTASRTLSGFVAGEINEKLTIEVKDFDTTILHEGVTSTDVNRFDLPNGGALVLPVGSVTTFFYNKTINRWQILNAFVRLNGNDVKNGALTLLGLLTGVNVDFTLSGSGGATFRGNGSNNYASSPIRLIATPSGLNPQGGIALNDSTHDRVVLSPDGAWQTRDAAGAVISTHRDGRTSAQRGSAATHYITLEQRSILPVAGRITTDGALNNYPINSVTAHYYFDRLDDLTGLANAESGRMITIRSGAALNIHHEDAASDAANRFSIIGGATLVQPAGGVSTWIYFSSIGLSARWYLYSKNY